MNVLTENIFEQCKSNLSSFLLPHLVSGINLLASVETVNLSKADFSHPSVSSFPLQLKKLDVEEQPLSFSSNTVFYLSTIILLGFIHTKKLQTKGNACLCLILY